MPTPPKPFSVLKSENKSHRTKAELEIRKLAEEQLCTGFKMKEREEVKKNADSHKEFTRINKLLKSIDKNDELFAAVINRYCQMYAECRSFEIERNNFVRRAKDLEEKEELLVEERKEMNYKEFYSLLNELEEKVIALDKQIQAKRKMMFEYEKENLMTIASGLRSIPKKESSETDPLVKALGGERVGS